MTNSYLPQIADVVRTADIPRAETARAGAEAAQAAAQTARTGAETARTGAETARTGAETARTGAETARTGAEAAQTAAAASAAAAAADAAAIRPVITGGTGANNAASARTNLDISAANTPFAPAGAVAAANVQAAIVELDNEKMPKAGGAFAGGITGTTAAFTGLMSTTGDVNAANAVLTGNVTAVNGAFSGPVIGAAPTLGTHLVTRDAADSRYTRREKLTADRTYFVRSDGSDVNTGLVNSGAGAFRTIEKAINVIRKDLDLGGFGVTINTNSSPGLVSGSPVTFDLVPVGGGSVSMTTGLISHGLIVTGAGVVLRLVAGGQLGIGGPVNQALLVTNNALVVNEAATFSATAPGGGSCIVVENGGVFRSAVNFSVLAAAGSMVNALVARSSGVIDIRGAVMAVNAAPTVTAMAFATMNGVIHATAAATGTATGTRHSATLNGVINVNGAGANAFPGTVAGTVATGGQFAA